MRRTVGAGEPRAACGRVVVRELAPAGPAAQQGAPAAQALDMPQHRWDDDDDPGWWLAGLELGGNQQAFSHPTPNLPLLAQCWLQRR